MTGTWRNWTGDQVCRPARTVTPRNRDELVAAVAEAAAAEERVSVVGSGHSFTGTALTDGVAIDVAALSGALDVDRASGLVEVGAGTVIGDLNRLLDGLGLAMENLGDIDRQTIAGAISTATHGTGASLPNISGQVEAVELVTAAGDVRRLDRSEPELLAAARVGVGALGAISSVTLRCVPAFTLRRVDVARPRQRVLDDFERQLAAHDHFELFTFPYSDLALVLERNRVDGQPQPRGRAAATLNDTVLENWALGALAATGKRFPAAIPHLSKLAGRLASGGVRTEASHRIFASERRVRFTEMEYAVPRQHGPEAVRRAIEWVRSNRYPVFFPIEVRVGAADDALLSPAHDRDTAYIAVHQYRGMEWRPYFEAVEEIMRDYGGRPHWGKRHFQTAATLAPLYPAWDRFQAARDELDPRRVFTNEYAERVLG
ncbi:MAG TPA: D-arabinono-1,4-lactone oxidase [Solirubrobacterales bacterium]|nr:D-arabinono-1,4-lactone oxidase [Solirubrobacterales bacterium]